MNKVAVYFHAPHALDYPLDEPGYFESYKNFTAYCAQRNTAFYIVRGDSYLGDMTFKSGWQFVGDQLVEAAGPIQVDLIYVKD